MYFSNLESKASPKAIPLAAITCSNGPPWFPGKIAESRRDDIFFRFPFLSFKPKGLSKSLPIIIIPPLGPRRVLWVVDVITWQWGTGSLKNPFAIKPDGWAMSAWRKAPTSLAISLNFEKSISLEYAEAPTIIKFGVTSFAFLRISL